MIYIQTSEGLTQITSSLTKEKIIAALGYTPADDATFYEDKSGELVIADSQGYIIAKINADGFTSTKISAEAIALNGEDLATKLKSLEDSIGDIDIPNVETYDTHVANEAIHVTEDQKTAWNNKSDFSGAYKDLEGAPNIVNDNEDEVVICDSAGNVILRATAEGLNVAAIYINGKAAIPTYDDTMEGAVLKIVSGAPTWVIE